MDNLGQERREIIQEDDVLEIDLREYAALVWKRKWILIILVIAAVILAYILSGMMTPIYQTSTLIMVKQDSGMGNLFEEQLSFFAGQSNRVAAYTEMLKSRRILQQVIDELNLVDEEEGEPLSPQFLKSAINISGDSSSNLITITVTYPDPVMAAEIANNLVERFQVENQKMNRADLTSAAGFINEQLEKVQVNLAELEEDLLAYQEEHDVVLPGEQGKSLLDKLVNLETRRAETQLVLEQARVSLEELQKHILREEREIIATRTISNNPVVMKSKEQLAELQVELAGLKEVYTDQHPRVIEVKKKIDEVQRMLHEAVGQIVSAETESLNPVYQTLKEKIINLQATIIGAEAQLKIYDEEISRLKEELVALPEKELELTRLQRETRVAESIYLLLMEKREEIQIQEAMQSSDIMVIDSAAVPETPIKPKKKLNVVIAAFLAVFIGLGIIFLLEYLDTTVKDEKDIERLTGLPVLGVIPDVGKINHSYGYGRNDE